MFLSLDGVDGAGKSTQLKLLAGWLAARGELVTCRDPGSTELGEAVREILLGTHDTPIGRRGEMLLYMAARAQMVEQVIRPALARGATVLSDRFLLANVVYQGHAGGLPPAEIWNVGLTATGGLLPDLNIVLDLPIEVARSRINRSLDRMEQRGEAFFAAVRQGFLAEAAEHRDSIRVIDASSSVDEVQGAIRREIEALPAWNR
ncbi:MAG: dTMP kinase [Planctomycetes bacterium]|nr:dTMP kinase [Planctomycetota bacterium]